MSCVLAHRAGYREGEGESHILPSASQEDMERADSRAKKSRRKDAGPCEKPSLSGAAGNLTAFSVK